MKIIFWFKLTEVNSLEYQENGWYSVHILNIFNMHFVEWKFLCRAFWLDFTEVCPLAPVENGWHFANILTWILLKENYCILIKISMVFTPKSVNKMADTLQRHFDMHFGE